MTVRIKLFAYFRELFGGRERELAVAARATVGDALALLADTPERRRELFAGEALRPHLVLMLNGTPVSSLQGLATPLQDGDILAVFPMLGGG